MLKKALVGIVLNALALYGVIYLMDEVTYTGGIKMFIIAGVVIGLLNAFVKPILKILSFPFMILTGGLFLVVINGGILWFTQYFMSVIQFRDVALNIEGLGTYFLAALLFGLINWVEHLIIKNN